MDKTCQYVHLSHRLFSAVSQKPTEKPHWPFDEGTRETLTSTSAIFLHLTQQIRGFILKLYLGGDRWAVERGITKVFVTFIYYFFSCWDWMKCQNIVIGTHWTPSPGSWKQTGKRQPSPAELRGPTTEWASCFSLHVFDEYICWYFVFNLLLHCYSCFFMCVLLQYC